MTAEPPFESPLLQTSVISVALKPKLERETGASGFVMITAPFPGADATELLFALMAYTVA